MNLFSLPRRCIVFHKILPILLSNPPFSQPPCEKIQIPVSLDFQFSAQKKDRSLLTKTPDNPFHCPYPRHLEIPLSSICEIQDFSTLRSAHPFQLFLLEKRPWTTRNQYHHDACQIPLSYISYC